MADIKVSVIMPVYGVEDYVGKAIESIQAQTLTDWEFFCVDDGTKDHSGEICDEYAAKDPRIKVIHKENGGAPSARNVAIDKAVGKYMYFMDSDDWTEPDMLEKMVATAEKNNELYKKYAALAEKENVLFGGRLAQYKYFDMDDTVEEALLLADNLL